MPPKKKSIKILTYDLVQIKAGPNQFCFVESKKFEKISRQKKIKKILFPFGNLSDYDVNLKKILTRQKKSFVMNLSC